MKQLSPDAGGCGMLAHDNVAAAGRTMIQVIQLELCHARSMVDALVVAVRLKGGCKPHLDTAGPVYLWHSARK